MERQQEYNPKHASESINLNTMHIEDRIASLIEIEFDDEQGFPMIRETLSRMGISAKPKDGGAKRDLADACDVIEDAITDCESKNVQFDGMKEAKQFVKDMDNKYDFGESLSDKPVLYQSCHILQKRGRYFIVHFKELYGLDGKTAIMSQEDYARRNTIARKLESWGMCRILVPELSQQPLLKPQDELTIISHSEKKNWNLESKYSLGSK